MIRQYEADMKIKTYNKLVRDKIPEIISKDGRFCSTRVLNEDEYLTSMNAKLQEELNEYLSSGKIEELADLEEVLRAILDAKKVTYDEFEDIRKKKVEKRGAFKKRIFLESVAENDDR